MCAKAKAKVKFGGDAEQIVKVDDWLDEDHLLLIAGWTRDGYTYKDIAKKIGISSSAFNRWRNRYPQFNQAMKEGREIVDYKVENALLKSALGYETKETKVTILMRYGKVVEETKETTTREVVPNVTAIQTWLYNRLPDKWNRRNGNLAEDLGEDNSIHIEVTRAKRDELNATVVEGDSNEDSDWTSSVNSSVSVRKATEQEMQAASQYHQAEEQEADTEWDDSDEEVDIWEGVEEVDEDYWPEDDEWEAMKVARKQSESKQKQSEHKKKPKVNNFLVRSANRKRAQKAAGKGKL